MLAVRAPLIGVVVAMLLLIAENLGANAYRDQVRAKDQPQVSEQMRTPTPYGYMGVKHCHDDRPHKGD
jgi:hypothetical protein